MLNELSIEKWRLFGPGWEHVVDTPSHPLDSAAMIWVDDAQTKLWIVGGRSTPGGHGELLMHGLTSSHQSPLFAQVGPGLATNKVSALAVQSRRSGIDGHNNSVLENDLEDIEAWVQFLLSRGYKKIVLAGASMGSLSVGRYQSIQQNPNVVAIAHLMPTADCSDWFERAAGKENYKDMVIQAKPNPYAHTFKLSI